MNTIIIERTSKIKLPVASLALDGYRTLRLIPCKPSEQQKHPSFIGYLKLEDRRFKHTYQTVLLANKSRHVPWFVRDDHHLPWCSIVGLHSAVESMMWSLMLAGHEFPCRLSNGKVEA